MTVLVILDTKTLDLARYHRWDVGHKLTKTHEIQVVPDHTIPLDILVEFFRKNPDESFRVGHETVS